MNENLEKVKAIFKSQALTAIVRWSEPVRWAVVGISSISVINTLLALNETLVTKSLIDGATSSNARALWVYGAALIALIAVGRLLSVASAYM